MTDGRRRLLVVFVSVFLASCGGGGDAAPVEGGPDAARAAAGPEAGSAGGAMPAAAPATGTEGRITFTAGGEAQVMDHLPEGSNYYTPLASQVGGKPSPDSPAGLTITFLSMDLGGYTYPLELPARPQGGPPAGNVGFSYTDAQGREWAGPGRLLVESFEGGVLVARFGEVRLPHVDRAHPEITLSGGEVRAAIR